MTFFAHWVQCVKGTSAMVISMDIGTQPAHNGKIFIVSVEWKWNKMRRTLKLAQAKAYFVNMSWLTLWRQIGCGTKITNQC